LRVNENKHSTDFGAWLTFRVIAHTDVPGRVRRLRVTENKRSTEFGAGFTVRVFVHTSADVRGE